MATIIQIQFKRDSSANWTSNNPVLADGEPGYDTTKGLFKIGDGATAWVSLAYQTATYVFNQGVAAASWFITHNLAKWPSVTVVDSAGTKVEGCINYINSNTLQIDFSAPFSGKAYLN